jgi:hypothetical protein
MSKEMVQHEGPKRHVSFHRTCRGFPPGKSRRTTLEQPEHTCEERCLANSQSALSPVARLACRELPGLGGDFIASY